jgi:hypothetical protein
MPAILRREPAFGKVQRNMVHRAKHGATEVKETGEASIGVLESLPLWQLDIAELTGHNLEARGREEVNHLLQTGWRLLHIYTLKYEEDGVWRERPMAILGRPRNGQKKMPDPNGLTLS